MGAPGAAQGATGRGRPRPGRGAHARRGRATLVRTVVGRRPAGGAADEGPDRGLRRRRPERTGRSSSGGGAASATSSSPRSCCSSCTGGTTRPCGCGARCPRSPRWPTVGTSTAQMPAGCAPATGSCAGSSTPSSSTARARRPACPPIRSPASGWPGRSGSATSRTGSAVDDLDRELGACRATVRSIHERLYFRPLLEAFSGVDGPLRPDAAAERLAAFGFSDGERTRRAVEELTQGLTRSSKLMLQLLPLVLDWLSTTPDPDGGLLLLRQLASGPTQALAMAAAFRESPETARRLAIVLGTSRKLGTQLVRNPDLIETVGGGDTFVRRRAGRAGGGGPGRGRPAHRHRRTAAARCAASPTARVSASARTTCSAWSRRWTDRRWSAPRSRTSRPRRSWSRSSGRSRRCRSPSSRSAGSAGAELAYASDLDLLLVHGGHGPEDQAEAERAWAEVHQFIVGDTPATLVYDVDLDLRPGRPQRSRSSGRSTGTAPTSSAGRRPGSARPWCGPGRWPATSRSGGGCSTTSPRWCGRRSPTTTGGPSGA